MAAKELWIFGKCREKEHKQGWEDGENWNQIIKCSDWFLFWILKVIFFPNYCFRNRIETKNHPSQGNRIGKIRFVVYNWPKWCTQEISALAISIKPVVYLDPCLKVQWTFWRNAQGNKHQKSYAYWLFGDLLRSI